MRTRAMLCLSLIVPSLWLAGCASAPPPETTMTDDNTFTPCDGAPHCVSSQAAPDDSHYVEPFAYATDARTARYQLLGLIREQPRTAIKTAEDRYIHATFSTRLGFTDDVYFLFRNSEQKIDVKSTSRVGYYDMGVNHRRVERLRALFDERLSGL